MLRLPTDEEMKKMCERSPDFHGCMLQYHVTNLDFYRRADNLKFLELFVFPHCFSRDWDDQLAVLAPVVIEAPEPAWDVRPRGFVPGVYHNEGMDCDCSHKLPVINVRFQKKGSSCRDGPMPIRRVRR